MPMMTAQEAWVRMAQTEIPDMSDLPFDILHFSGQSLSLGIIGTSIQKDAANRIDRHGVKMLDALQRGDTGGQVFINGPMTAGYNFDWETTSIGPAAAGGNIALVLYLGQALRRRRDAAGIENPIILAGCNGIGGQAIDAFHDDPATGSATQYGNLIWHMRDYWMQRAWAATEGKVRRVPYLGFIQGEADSNAAAGVYAAGMEAMWDSHLAQVFAVTGQVPVVCSTQVGGYASSLTATKKYFVCTEQVEVVEARNGVVLPPWYPMLLWDNNVHPNDGGVRDMADLIAHHLVRYEQGRKIAAFKPTATRDGNTVKLDYPLTSGETLEFAPDKYASYGGCPNYGFEVGGAAITGVTIGADQRSVVISCDAPPTSWAYAFQFQDVTGFADGNGENYGAHRGLLRKTTPINATLRSGVLYEWALSWRGVIS